MNDMTTRIPLPLTLYPRIVYLTLRAETDFIFSTLSVIITMMYAPVY